MNWTKDGLKYKASVNILQYQIKKVSETCKKCSGAGRIGELVKCSICCPGYEDKNGYFLNCPNETNEEDDCIVYRFESEDGSTSFEACKDCGPLRFPTKVIMMEKINPTFIGKEICPDCSKDGDIIQGSGKIVTYQLISPTGEILATSKSSYELRIAISNIQCKFS